MNKLLVNHNFTRLFSEYSGCGHSSKSYKRFIHDSCTSLEENIYRTVDDSNIIVPSFGLFISNKILILSFVIIYNDYLSMSIFKIEENNPMLTGVEYGISIDNNTSSGAIMFRL